MICGYARSAIGDHGELELKEISFGLRPHALRLVAAFLSAAADEMETESTRPHWHRHIDEFSPDWRRTFPGCDIVVVAAPNDDAHPSTIDTQ
jgi:hypothetical protein